MDSRNRLQAALFGGTPDAAWVRDGVVTTRHGDTFVLESVVNGKIVTVEISKFTGPYLRALRALLERTAIDLGSSLRCDPLTTG